MMFKSINVLCDASPKSFREASWPYKTAMFTFPVSRQNIQSEVWVPVLSVGDTAAAWSIQQLSDLMRSEASDNIKMQEAEKVIDAMAERFVEKDKETAKAKMCLSFIRSIYANIKP